MLEIFYCLFLFFLGNAKVGWLLKRLSLGTKKKLYMENNWKSNERIKRKFLGHFNLFQGVGRFTLGSIKSI